MAADSNDPESNVNGVCTNGYLEFEDEVDEKLQSGDSDTKNILMNNTSMKNNPSAAFENGSSSLLERIRAKQQKQATSSTSIISDNNYKQASHNEEVEKNLHPLSNSVENSNLEANHENDKNIIDKNEKKIKNTVQEPASFLPITRFTPPRSKIDGLTQQSIFPPPTTTLKHDANPMKITQTVAYSYTGRPNPPIEISRPSARYYSDTENLNTTANTSAKIFNTLQNSVYTIKNKIRNISGNESTDSYRYKPIHEGGGYNGYLDNSPLIMPGDDDFDDMEGFRYTNMNGGSDEEEEIYSMKGYFVTFCRDMYELSFGRLPNRAQIVVMIVLLVFFFWYLVDVL